MCVEGAGGACVRACVRACVSVCVNKCVKLLIIIKEYIYLILVFYYINLYMCVMLTVNAFAFKQYTYLSVLSTYFDIF